MRDKGRLEEAGVFSELKESVRTLALDEKNKN